MKKTFTIKICDDNVHLINAMEIILSDAILSRPMSDVLGYSECYVVSVDNEPDNPDSKQELLIAHNIGSAQEAVSKIMSDFAHRKIHEIYMREMESEDGSANQD